MLIKNGRNEYKKNHTHDHDRPKGIKEAPVACLIAIGVTSTGCLVLFFYPDPVYDLMRQIVTP